MIIQRLPSGPFETNAYVVGCPKTNKAAIIDPGVSSKEAIFNFIKEQKLEPIAIILTHSHWDHIGDAASLKKQYHIPVWIHEQDKENLQSPGTDGLPCFEEIEGVTADKFLTEGETITIGSLKFEVIHTPGHTPGGICLFCQEPATLLSGDTLFKGSIGNLSFPTANPDQMWSSLKKLETLPPKTRILPGHGPESTIGEENWLPQAKEIFENF